LLSLLGASESWRMEPREGAVSATGGSVARLLVADMVEV